MNRGMGERRSERSSGLLVGVAKRLLNKKNVSEIFLNERVVTSAGLAIILAVAFSVNLWFVSHDNRPPSWDYAVYLGESVRLYDARGSFAQLATILGGGGESLVTGKLPPTLFRPPLVPLASLPFYVMFGVSYGSAMLANLVFIAILVLSTYWLAKVMSDSHWSALVAAGIISTLPGVIAYGRVYGLDLPTAALVSAGLYLTVAVQGFKTRGRSIVLGAVVGLGMLTKWTYFIFVAPMIIVELVRHRRSVNLRNMILFGLAAAGVPSAWYARAVQQGLIGKLIAASWGPGSKYYAPSGNMFDLSSLLFYPGRLYISLIGPLYGITLIVLVCMALLLAVRKRQSLTGSKLAMPLALSFLLPLSAFSLVTNKDTRFLLPALPCLVVLLACVGWRTQLGRIRIGPALLLVVVLAGLFTSVIGSLQPTVGYHLGIYSASTISDQFENDYTPYSLPKPYDWKIAQVIEFVGKQNPHANIGILASHWAYNQDTLVYYALLMGFDGLRFRDFRDGQVVPPYDNLDNYDFILIKSDRGGEVLGESVTKIRERLANPEDTFYLNHEMIQSFDLPDSSQLLVFARNTVSASLETNPAPYQPQLLSSDHSRADHREISPLDL